MWILAEPRLWRLIAVLLGAPVLVTICIGVAAAIDAALTPGARGASPDSMTFALVVGGLGVIWLVFVSRSLVRARRARLERVDPLPVR